MCIPFSLASVWQCTYARGNIYNCAHTGAREQVNDKLAATRYMRVYRRAIIHRPRFFPFSAFPAPRTYVHYSTSLVLSRASCPRAIYTDVYSVGFYFEKRRFLSVASRERRTRLFYGKFAGLACQTRGHACFI